MFSLLFPSLCLYDFSLPASLIFVFNRFAVLIPLVPPCPPSTVRHLMLTPVPCSKRAATCQWRWAICGWYLFRRLLLRWMSLQPLYRTWNDAFQLLLRVESPDCMHYMMMHALVMALVQTHLICTIVLWPVHLGSGPCARCNVSRMIV